MIKNSLVNWSYSAQEWQQFQKWKAGKAHLFLQLLHFLKKSAPGKSSFVQITKDHVWINNSAEPFQNSTRSLRDILIREAGNINVMEISYENGKKTGAITVPVPKGKLKEAIEVQQYFSMAITSV